MQARTTAYLLALAALFACHVLLLGKAAVESKNLSSDAESGFVIPSTILKLTSLEFKGSVSDMLFIKAMVFVGRTLDRKNQPRMKPDEWQWLDKLLNASTDMDSYFEDPYYLANAHMPWDGGMARETNVLLEKGIQSRDWDWNLPFFAGFNSFFFLHDNTKASEYLMTASQRPGPSERLISLASRLAYKGRNTENAIIFLDALVRKTDDEQLKKEYDARIRALRVRLVLEKAVSDYTLKFGRTPTSLQRLIEKKIIKNIPADPYGGQFSIEPNGEIIGTSDYLLMPKQK